MSFLGPTKRILVIDDEEDLVEYIRIILRTRGYESIPAYDGEQGLALLQSEQPDLVICDLRMPKMSGLELARRRKDLPQHLASIPFLVVSSMGNEQQRPDSFWCEGLGCDDFLAKPFEPLTFLGRVEALLRREKYRSNETPQPSQDTPPPRPVTPFREDRPRPAVRQFTVKATSTPVEVVRSFIDESWGATRLQPGDLIWVHLTAPRPDTRVLDASILFQTAEEAEVAVLREEGSPDGGSQPVAFDERYTLVCPDGEWKISRIHQEPLVTEA
jgi:DNA-binding response OmpR family regulator